MQRIDMIREFRAGKAAEDPTDNIIDIINRLDNAVSGEELEEAFIAIGFFLGLNMKLRVDSSIEEVMAYLEYVAKIAAEMREKGYLDVKPYSTKVTLQ
jgi:hypothetical protein